MFFLLYYTVRRSCGATRTDNKYCETPEEVEIDGISAQFWTCVCEGDLCNGGLQITAALTVILSGKNSILVVLHNKQEVFHSIKYTHFMIEEI